MTQISITNLTFYYDGHYENIFENTTFQFDTAWKLGLIGRNGKGKTTFLKLLQGQYEYRGTIQADTDFEYFPYPVRDTHRNTLEVIEDVSPDYELWKICRELNELKVDCEVLYRPFETLSHGEQTKVMLAVLFSKDNKFLLIDEPTNHLDMEGRKLLGDYLNQKKGFLLVSHDREFLDRCIDHVLALDRARITVTKGNFSVWQQEKERQDQAELAQNETLKKDIRKLQQSAKEVERWAGKAEKAKFEKVAGLRPDRGFMGHKAAKIMKRSKNLENRMQDAIEEKEGLLKNVETVEDLKLFPLTHHKKVLVRMQEVSIAYGQKTVLDGFGMTLEAGERIALQGANGCGKSSILKLVTGENQVSSGTLELASGLIISYIPQNTGFLKGMLNDYIADEDLDETLFKSILRKLDFSRTQFEKRMEDFSEGQRKKVLIAGSLCRRAHLYVWDEPLNYIDLFSRMQIEKLILSFEPTMLMVEHDRAFVERAATRKILLPGIF
ncbi:MAG: ABC-F type ribosomal protection protein [Eubacteriales bacterium]|nr:ABC-F type ribosomal protection protein [Eubacteriales bacterium]